MNYWELRSQPKGMTVDRASNPSDKIIDYLYEYNDASGNNNNRIRKITDNVDTSYTTTYLYDDYNRLTHATSNASSSYFLYDEWGNIKNLSGLQINHAANASGAPATNRISTDSQSYSYTWDAAGNMTGGAGQSLSYDGANRLKTANGGTSTYGYDGNGMRARVTDNGAAVFYIQSAMLPQTAMEVTSTGVHRAYVYAAGRVAAMQASDGQFYWLHTNHLGSARAMTDVSGSLTYRGRFAPYGEAVSEWSSSGNTNLNKKKFAGYERDAATGLDYANARMYNSGRGRFLQADRLGLGAANVNRPQTLNRYAYTSNDPINFVDPTGLDQMYVWKPPVLPPRPSYAGGGSGYGHGGCSGQFTFVAEPGCDGTFGYDPGPSGWGSEFINELASEDLKNSLIQAIEQLPPDCVKAVGGVEKVFQWSDHVRNGDVRIYNSTSNAQIPNHHQTVSQYWNDVGSRSLLNSLGMLTNTIHGMTVVTQANPDMANHNDARKYNTIIIGPSPRSTTLIHEFLHWETAGNHLAIADKLGLSGRGYDVSTDEKAGDAINQFFANNCRNKE
jgi:RHS repeat-associated protein